MMADKPCCSKGQLKKRANTPLIAVYIEVNDVNFPNINCYNMPTGEPLFDIGIIFAANIKFDTTEQKAWLHLNENVTRVLTNAEQYIRPLQERGIKVLLSILGGGEGAGVSNFQDVEAARDYAQILKDVVDEYGLDGIDLDDEYAEYGQHPNMPNPNDFSFLYLIRELRQLMPDKIISFYYYGPASQRLIYENLVAGDYLDYSWNAIYSSYNPPNVPNLPDSRKAPAAVWINNTPTLTAAALAQRTKDEGYGAYLCYNLPNSDVRNYMTNITQILYGTSTILTPNCLEPWTSSGGGPLRRFSCSHQKQIEDQSQSEDCK